MMEEHCDIKVKFERRLGGGNNGTVYKVNCQTRVVKVEESDQPSSSQGSSTSKPKFIYLGTSLGCSLQDNAYHYENQGIKTGL